MGAIAEGFVAYAQPLIDLSDGSTESVNKAFALAQFCFNLSILPAKSQREMLSKFQQEMSMNDEEFEDFRQALIDPMLRRHEALFPLMHQRHDDLPFEMGPALEESDKVGYTTERSTTVDRYAPCPCNSGKKYKFCCGRKAR